MIKDPKLTPEQWKLLASVATNLSQAIVLFSLAAFFIPEAMNLPGDFSNLISLAYLSCGLILLAIGVTIIKKGK
ncbi:hypothetical protein HYZ70_00560 [Candidatus Curtissbacteria bacterium]|nr:hypothetical protein [Candidatus Curtissbacteria bacterium]